VHKTKAPRVLIIQLDRFTDVRPIGSTQPIFTKNLLNVSPDLQLSLSDNDQVSVEYKLSAIIHHSGNYIGGHYNAAVLHRSPERWFICNDKAVLDGQVASSDTPYVLFYVMKSLEIS